MLFTALYISRQGGVDLQQLNNDDMQLHPLSASLSYEQTPKHTSIYTPTCRLVSLPGYSEYNFGNGEGKCPELTFMTFIWYIFVSAHAFS